MAGSKKSRSYVVRLLRVMREAGKPQTEAELMAGLSSRFSEGELQRWQKVSLMNIGETLRELQELGVVRSLRVQGGDEIRWVLSSEYVDVAPDGAGTGPIAAFVIPQIAGVDADSEPATGGGGDGGSQDGGNESDDPPGDGLREVLDHDVLFCVDDDDFEAAVAACVQRH